MIDSSTNEPLDALIEAAATFDEDFFDDALLDWHLFYDLQDTKTIVKSLANDCKPADAAEPCAHARSSRRPPAVGRADSRYRRRSRRRSRGDASQPSDRAARRVQSAARDKLGASARVGRQTSRDRRNEAQCASTAECREHWRSGARGRRPTRAVRSRRHAPQFPARVGERAALKTRVAKVLKRCALTVCTPPTRRLHVRIVDVDHRDVARLAPLRAAAAARRAAGAVVKIALHVVVIQKAIRLRECAVHC